MAIVETTTIRVRRSTHELLTQEAELAGKSVIEMLEIATEMLKEQRMLESMHRSYEKYGDEIHAEMAPWLNMPGPPLPDDDWSDLTSDED